MNAIERKAALAVIGAAAAVSISSIRLMRRYTRYMSKKAAAFFDEEQQRQADLRKEEKHTPSVSSVEELPSGAFI